MAVPDGSDPRKHSPNQLSRFAMQIPKTAAGIARPIHGAGTVDSIGGSDVGSGSAGMSILVNNSLARIIVEPHGTESTTRLMGPVVRAGVTNAKSPSAL